MDVKSFSTYWDNTYAGLSPTGEALRNGIPDRWLRIHTLPTSKRYPDSNLEMAEILRRHNALIGEVLDEGDPYVTVVTGYGSAHLADGSIDLGGLPIDSFEYWKSEAFEDDAWSDASFWHFYLAENVWSNRSADLLLSKIARDKIANVLFVAPGKQFIYHPYDGGGDAFPRNAAIRNQLYERYFDWTSRHPSGL